MDNHKEETDRKPAIKDPMKQVGISFLARFPERLLCQEYNTIVYTRIS